MSKSNTTICTAKNCYSSLVTHPSKSFFGFPSEISLCKIWLENCGRTDLNLQQVCKRSHWRLCEDHFEDKWFTDNSRKILKRKLNPIPTIFVNNINSLLPPGHESVTTDSENISMSVDSDTETDNEDLTIFSPHTRLLNPDSMCRFCLNEISPNYVDMFSETEDAREIRKVSKVVLPSEVSICDGLPHKVCLQCTADLKTCWKLIEQFQNADRYLRSIANCPLFADKKDRTIEIEHLKNGNDNYNIILPILKTTTDFQFTSCPRTFEESSCGNMNEVNTHETRNLKNNVNRCKYIKSSTDSGSKHTLRRKRSKSEGSTNKLSSGQKRNRQFLNMDSRKCYKKSKQNQSKDLLTK